jgi:molybdate transport system ATP-binding protein
MSEQSSDYLISITNVDVSREGWKVLRSISWQLRPGEKWAVIGANGAGKSTFLKLIRGDLWPDPKKTARRIYCLEGERQDTPLGMRKLIGLVDPELQDRYVRNGIDIPGEEVVLTGFFDSVWLQERPSPSMVRAARRLISFLGLDDLRKRSILAMSRGEARKVLIARALVFNPRVLLMDEVFSGLDPHARKQLSGLLEKTVQGGVPYVLATHRISGLDSFITHAALLKEGGIFLQGRREQVLAPDNLRYVLGLRETVKAGRKDRVVRQEAETGPLENRRSVIKMRGVNVYMGQKIVLGSIDWELKAGENWAVVGKNGAGKSTFLRLVAGDCRPASGGNIRRFGVGGSGSIWDLKKKIGYISPELQAEYDENMTGEDVVVSGFFSSIGLYRRVTPKQRRLSGELMRRLGIEKLGPRQVDRMSYGEFRKILIARALVKAPALLLLDEPFSGLDSRSKSDFAKFLNRISQDPVGMILVTHHRDEIIPSISHVLVLDHGKIAAQGPKEEILKEDLFVMGEEPLSRRRS